MQDCLFCDYKNSDQHKVIAENSLFYARWDNFPVSKGHAEVVPKKHIDSFFELSKDDIGELLELAKQVQEMIREQYSPDGFNIGVNDGVAAGRTIHHLHVHIIPRYKGDVDDPVGGVRHVIPDKGKY